jgi:oligopeptide transport system ATP-binding protein
MTKDQGEPVLAVSGLSKRFGDVTAVDDVSLEVAAGGSLAIVGESGSGKTTVARILTGLTTPSSGTVRACGEDRTRPARSLRDRRRRAQQVQMVFQDPYSSLDPRYTAARTIEEAVTLHARSRSAQERRRRVEELGELVGLGPAQLAARPAELSGGQRQRIAIARALAVEPALLILDEPVAALDVSIQAQVLNLLTDIRTETGISYLFISHDLAVVRHVTDDLMVMCKGEVVERGRTAEVLAAPQHPYTQVLLASVPRPGWRPTRSLGQPATRSERPGVITTRGVAS